MSALALDYLRERLPDSPGDESDPWEWYLRVREEHPDMLSPYLVEPPRESMSANYYVLRADPQDVSSAILEQREFIKDKDEQRLPWFKLPGNNSGDAGPIIKRNTNAGPKPSVTKQTFKRFKGQIQSGASWASYFAEIMEVFERKNLRFRGKTYDFGINALDTAIKIVPEDKATCLLSYADDKGYLPGERKDYAEYLQSTVPYYKYTTVESQPVKGKPCALCSTVSEVYPSALRGAGLNLTNVDRTGVFAGLDDQFAWKKFAICSACADLLYIFSYYMQDWFLGRVAGEKALLVPYTTIAYEKRLRFVKRTREYIRTVSKGNPIAQQEKRLRDLAEEDAIASITILWANFGQELGDVRGMVADVLPSRLRAISEIVNEVNEYRSAPFPENSHEPLKLDIALNSLGGPSKELEGLLKRPGGKRTEKVNKGARLFEFKREIAAAVYHGQRVPVERFWEEAREVWEAYLIDALERNHYGLLYEGRTKQGETYLTMAGWIRHLSRFIYFLRRLEVYPRMEDWRYRPRNQRLRSIFGEFFEDAEGRSGIDKPEKAYAFLLGALFGKLMQVQGARGVNVGANALPWLKRFTLTGKDLPELYVKIREKLLTYGTRSRDIADVIEELGYLGTNLGTRIDLNQTETGYFLLLGQSLSSTFMPSKGAPTSENTNIEETA